LRHQVWLAAVVSALAMPALPTLLPAWHANTLALALARWGTARTLPTNRIGGNVEAAHLFTQVMPVYPEKAKAAGVEGTVVLHAIIGKDGTPLALRVINGNIDPELARASVEAVSHWRHRPTLLNGEPVEVDTTIEVSFTLNKE
jgi:TonB family protein